MKNVDWSDKLATDNKVDNWKFARRAIALPLHPPMPLTVEAVSPHKH